MEMYKDKERKRDKLAKYFEEMEEFTCKKMANSDVINAGIKPFKSI